jgi:hypothetical protein
MSYHGMAEALEAALGMDRHEIYFFHALGIEQDIVDSAAVERLRAGLVACGYGDWLGQ